MREIKFRAWDYIEEQMFYKDCRKDFLDLDFIFSPSNEFYIM